MELRQLEHFVSVAEERSFTHAAERLHIVQSGLSASIRALERELGVALFVRSTRRVELTEPGRALLSEARRTLAAAAGVREAVSDVQGLRRGTLRVGLIPATPRRITSYTQLPALLVRFHERYPGVEIELRQVHAPKLMDDLREGRLHLGFTALVGSAPAGVQIVPVGSYPLVLACAVEHPLAARGEVSVHDVGGEAFVDFPVGSATRTLVDRLFAAGQVEHCTAFEVNDLPLFMDLIAHGLGIAFVPRAIHAENPRICYVPLRPPAPVWEAVLAMPSEVPATAAARALAGMFLAELPCDVGRDAAAALSAGARASVPDPASRVPS